MPDTKANDRAAERYEYDVCLSFAGLQRAYVQRVADHLEASPGESIRVFYDDDERHSLVSGDLPAELAEIYLAKSRYCVVFASRAYLERRWPGWELRYVAERMFRDQSDEYLILVRFDDTEIPALLSTRGFFDGRSLPAEELARLIANRIRQSPAPPPRRRRQPAVGFVAQHLSILEEKPDGAAAAYRWSFVGREAAMRVLVQATRGSSRRLVVTGAAGTGKSAVLARLVALSDPEFRADNTELIRRLSVGVVPDEGAVHVAVYAQDKTTAEIIREIADGIEVRLPYGWTAGVETAGVQAIVEWLTTGKKRFTIVLDALDEASDPSDVLDRVLEPLAKRAGGWLRLLVGVRSSAVDPADVRPGGSSRRLADQVRTALDAAQLDLDRDEYSPVDDVVDYIEAVLADTPGSPYRGAGSAVRREIAEATVRRSRRSFLIAKIAARALSQGDAMVTPDDPGWAATVDEGLTGVFRRDLRSSVPDDDELRRAVMLLRAVAFAYGPGLPRDRIWPQVATAVDIDDRQSYAYGDGDVTTLLESRLASYLVTAGRDGTIVYRLSHDQLETLLRRQWRQLLDEDDRRTADDREITDVHRRIAGELKSSAIPRGRSAPVPYVRRHLAQHAYAGSVVANALQPEFLPFMDLAAFRDAMDASDDPDQIEAANSLLRRLEPVSSLWRWDHPDGNAAVLEMWAALTGDRSAGSVGGSWRAAWAVRPPDHSYRLGRHQGPVWAVAGAQLPSGPVVVTGGADGHLRVWDFRLGLSGDTPVWGQQGAVRSIATTTLPDGRVVAVSGGEAGVARIWELPKGREIGHPMLGHDGAVEAVATTVLDGEVLALTADSAGTIRRWSLPDGTPVGSGFPGKPGSALALAVVASDGGGLGVALGRDGWLRRLDLTRSTELAPLTAHPEAVTLQAGTVAGGRALATRTREPAGPTIFSVHSNDLLPWDGASGRARTGRLAGRGDRVLSLAVGPAPEQLLVAGGDSALRVWDPDSGEPGGARFDGPNTTMESVAVVHVDGRPFAVTGGRDGTVNRWSLEGAGPRPQDPDDRLGTIEAVATGRFADGRELLLACEGEEVRGWNLGTGDVRQPLVSGFDSPTTAVATAVVPVTGLVTVAGCWAGELVFRELESGRPAGPPIVAHDSPVLAVRTAVLPDGRAVAVSAGRWDGQLRVWDLATGSPVGEPLTGPADAVHDLALSTGADGSVTAVACGPDGIWSWEVGSEAAAAPTAPLGAGPGSAPAVCALGVGRLPDGRDVVVTGDRQGGLQVRELARASQVGPRWDAHSSAVRAVAVFVLPDGRLVAATAGEREAEVRLWDVRTRTQVCATLPTAGPVRALAIAAGPQPRLVIGGAGIAVVVPRPENGLAV